MSATLLRVLLVTLSLTCLRAQAPGRMNVVPINAAKGLPEVQIHALLQDRQGRYWAAGNGGIYLGDGGTFLRVLPEAPADRHRVLALGEDGEGRLWAAGDEGLWRLEGSRWKPFPADLPPLREEGPVGLHRDGAGRLWLQWEGLLARLEGDRFRPFPLPAPGLLRIAPRPRAPGLLLRRGREAWILDQDRWLPLPELPLRPGEEFRSPIHEDLGGTLWTATYLRLLKLEPGARQWAAPRQPSDPSGFAGGIARPAPGELWAVGDQAAHRLDQPEPPLQTVPAFHTFAMRLLLRDRDGHLWADQNGLHRIGGPWRIHGGADGLPVAGMWQALRDPAGSLWICTTQGLFRTEGAGWTKVWPAALHAQMAVGADGALWVTERQTRRVLRFEKGSRSPGPLPEALSGQQVLRGPSGSGRLLAFLLQDRVLLARWDQGTWRISPMATPTPKGTSWATTDGGGNLHLLWTTPEGILHHSLQGGPWTPLPVLGHGYTDLHAAGGDTLLGMRYSPAEIHRFKRGAQGWVLESRLPLARFGTFGVSYGLRVLEDGRTWALTDRGVLELDPRRPGAGRRYGPQDGLPIEDCNQFGILVEEDRIWISTGTGLASFDRRMDRPAAPLPAPFLQGIHWDDSPWLLESPTQFPAHTKAITLRVGLAAPQALAHSVYQWKDLDRDDQWRTFEGPPLTFLDPTPGPHRLRLRLLEPGGLPSPELALDYAVRHAWWRRPWALALWPLLLAAAAVAFHRFRLRRISARNRMLEALVAQRTEALAASEARERAASQAKSIFLADMSHELRTPLNAILLYSQLIQEEAQEAGHGQMAKDNERILGAGRHLLSLINGILDLSKVEAGKMKLDWETVSIRDLMQEVALTLEPLARDRNDDLQLLLPGEELEWRTDPTKLRQVLLNLASNAIKFTTGGTITLVARRWDEDLMLEVRDTGVGMTPDQASRLFRAYEQPTQEGGFKSGGTGLGLIISRRYIELMGGTIAVDSAPGKGTTFRVKLPSRA